MSRPLDHDFASSNTGFNRMMGIESRFKGKGISIGVLEPQVHPSYAANRPAAVARDFDLPEVSRRFGSEHNSWFHCQRNESAELFRRISRMVSHNARVPPSRREKQSPFRESPFPLRCTAGLSRA